MEIVMALIFWISLFVVAYTYVGYGLVIYTFSKLKRRQQRGFLPDTDLPPVTLVIAAYNEELFITEKIHNTQRLDYPNHKLTVLIVTDGSTDRTPDLVAAHPWIIHHHEPTRKGKIHAVTRIMKFVNTPITVFCDANTFLNENAIRNLVRHYQDDRVGGVAGEKRIFKKEADHASGAGEGLYWKYESFLKKKDAEVGSIVGAAGELFSVRTALFEPPDENMIIEDFYLSMKIVGKGFRFAYEPDAFATESSSVSVEDEWKRKVRICAGAFQAMPKLVYLLNPFRYGIISFQYFSHRVLRWTLAPIALVLLLISNGILAWGNSSFYRIVLCCQIAFYLLALAGFYFRNRTIRVKGFFVPYYFVVMNAAVFAGFSRFLRGKQSVMWERANRTGTSGNTSNA